MATQKDLARKLAEIRSKLPEGDRPYLGGRLWNGVCPHCSTPQKIGMIGLSGRDEMKSICCNHCGRELERGLCIELLP